MCGSQGPTGAAGASILGSYETYGELIAEHPTGTIGDAYLVGGVLYVWNGRTNTWENMGSLVGETGPTGATGAGVDVLGVYASLAELQAAHPTGNPGDAYVVGETIYVWDTDSGSWMPAGPVATCILRQR